MNVAIALPPALEQDAGCLLARERVCAALGSAGVEVSIASAATGPVAGDCDVIRVVPARESSVGGASSVAPERYRISPRAATGRRELAIEGTARGIMYGLFRLAELIRVGRDPWGIEMTATPAFALRVFSEQGQLLNFPDHGYYSPDAPFVDEQTVRRETDEAKELIRHVVGLGYNAFTLLNPSIEEYIDYRHLDKKVYPRHARHRARSRVFCRHLAELCDYAHSLHVEVYLQVYEMQYPRRLHELYGVDLDSPNIERIMHARYRELFERVPLDGLIVTATECHPRAGYASKQLWKGKGLAGAARMATLCHDACKAVGKRCIFRLWWIAEDAEGRREVARRLPQDALLSIKNTGGDFWLNYPTTTAITDDATRKQPLVVVFDTFRQYDGWSRLFAYMQRWAATLRACRDNGVFGINAWGPWSAGCIWPDYEPGYLRDGEGRDQAPGTAVSWHGHWSAFRMFTRGFSPGQANAHLLGRLSWDPDSDPAAVARDFAALHLGQANAAAGAEALLATEHAFAEEYIGVRREAAHPCYMKWTMVFIPDDERRADAYRHSSPRLVLASNERALACVARMEAAFARTDPGSAPDADAYAAFKRGIDKTALYLRTFFLWRECWWRQRLAHDLQGDEKRANADAFHAAKARLMPLFERWRDHPEEAGFWRVTFRYGRPAISPRETFPYWRPRGEDTMETTASSWSV